MILNSPEVAFRSCAFCHEYMHNDNGEKMGNVAKTGDGKPLKRPVGVSPPCWKCPKGPAPYEKELSQKNTQAYRHYTECKAVGQFPNDAIVRRNAGIIRYIEDATARAKSDVSALAQVLVAVLTRGRV